MVVAVTIVSPFSTPNVRHWGRGSLHDSHARYVVCFVWCFLAYSSVNDLFSANPSPPALPASRQFLSERVHLSMMPVGGIGSVILSVLPITPLSHDYFMAGDNGPC